MTSNLVTLYEENFGHKPTKIEQIAAGGSSREYYRLWDTDHHSVIGTIGKEVPENRAFIHLSDTFASAGINVPKVICHNSSFTTYIQEDLGDTSLFSLLDSEDAPIYIEKCLRSLAKMQSLNGIDYSLCYPTAEFNSRMIFWDLNYFKYCFLKPNIPEFDENGLENDFHRLADNLISTPQKLWGFMYRDCQSRNVIIQNNMPYWIDFQGGRRGPCLYDIASFLWQAKAQFSDKFRSDMVSVYADEYALINKIEKEEIISRLPEFVLFRILQVLGAYGFRGIIQHKAHFVQSIPYALQNLYKLLSAGHVSHYPTLENILYKLLETKKFEIQSHEGLVVSIFSFSYKKGYPDDFTGNGGGFMFDCRAMHNPGRYEQYKYLTGRDKTVMDFLEEQGEVMPFLENAWKLTDPAVERYIKRGFTSLQIGFGCTGGQHRSVYSAEATARHISEKYPQATIKLIHREQMITTIFRGGQEQ